MCDRDGRGAEPRGRAIEERMPDGVGRMFDRKPHLARKSGHIGALDVESHPQCCGEIPAEFRIGISVRAAKLMIQVRRAHDVKALGLGELTQRTQQRDRIGAAGQRDSHTAAARKQSVIADGATDGVRDVHDRA
jgi:hypothetical protein